MLLRWTVRRQPCTGAERSSNTFLDSDCEYDANYYPYPFPNSDTHTQPTGYVYGDIYSYSLADGIAFSYSIEHPFTNGYPASHQYIHGYGNLATYQHCHAYTHLYGDGNRGYPPNCLGYAQPGCPVNYSHKSAY